MAGAIARLLLVVVILAAAGAGSWLLVERMRRRTSVSRGSTSGSGLEGTGLARPGLLVWQLRRALDKVLGAREDVVKLTINTASCAIVDGAVLLGRQVVLPPRIAVGCPDANTASMLSNNLEALAAALLEPVSRGLRHRFGPIVRLVNKRQLAEMDVTVYFRPDRAPAAIVLGQRLRAKPSEAERAFFARTSTEMDERIWGGPREG